MCIRDSGTEVRQVRIVHEMQAAAGSAPDDTDDGRGNLQALLLNGFPLHLCRDRLGIAGDGLV